MKITCGAAICRRIFSARRVKSSVRSGACVPAYVRSCRRICPLAGVHMAARERGYGRLRGYVAGGLPGVGGTAGGRDWETGGVDIIPMIPHVDAGANGGRGEAGIGMYDADT